MNNENLDYLQNNLKYLGFGDAMNASLSKAIEKGSETFNLKTVLDFPKPGHRDKPELASSVSYELSFSKSKESDLYFFNKYQASITASDDKDALNQTFYINKGKGVTAKESFNLLEGRAVNKDVILKSGEKANVWMKLDFEEVKDGNFAMKTFGEKYGFNLADTVDKFRISDIEKLGFKDQLLKSLERGNLHEISFSKDGKEMHGFVTANPQFKTLDFFDKEIKPVFSKAVDLNESVISAKSDQKAAVEEPVIEDGKKSRTR